MERGKRKESVGEENRERERMREGGESRGEGWWTLEDCV